MSGDRPYTDKSLQRALKCVAFRDWRRTRRGTIESAQQRGPVSHCVHGFRHSFVTMAAESGESAPNGIADRTLGHVNKNAVAARYGMSKQLENAARCCSGGLIRSTRSSRSIDS